MTVICSRYHEQALFAPSKTSSPHTGLNDVNLQFLCAQAVSFPRSTTVQSLSYASCSRSIASCGSHSPPITDFASYGPGTLSSLHWPYSYIAIFLVVLRLLVHFTSTSGEESQVRLPRLAEHDYWACHKRSIAYGCSTALFFSQLLNLVWNVEI